MRLPLIVGLLAMVGCATAPGPRAMEWDTIIAHRYGASAILTNGELVLSGRAIQSRATYAAPLTVECELQSGQGSSNGSFYIDFVPEGTSVAVLPQEYVGFKLRGDNTLEAWASRSNQPPRLIGRSTAIPVDPQGQYKLAVDVQSGGFAAHANGVPMPIDLPMPYGKFQIQLQSSPPPSQWHVRDFSVR
jgi:hypothetical protein